MLVYSKTAHAGPDTDPAAPHRNTVLCVVNLDPRAPQGASLDLDLAALGVDATRPYQVLDLLSDQSYTWQGEHPYVELHPGEQPAHILRVSQLPADGLPADGPA